ncbi:MAG: hypothetical protein ACI89T_001354, partial [Cognaticolwellia sp.]
LPVKLIKISHREKTRRDAEGKDKSQVS